jgi:hypothetical protein
LVKFQRYRREEIKVGWTTEPFGESSMIMVL